MKIRTKLLVINLICLSLVLTSCATTLHTRITRPAQLDLNGAETIAILPFTPSTYYEIREDSRGAELAVGILFRVFDRVGPEEKRCIDYLQSGLEEGLINSPYIELVSSASVSSALKNGTSNPSDIYLRGDVTFFDIFDDVRVSKVKVRDGDKETGRKPEYIMKKEYQRIVKLNFKYQVIDSYTNKILSYNKVELSGSSLHYEHPERLPSAFSIIESDLNRAIRKILKELQPYEITKSITLEKDKTKNAEFKHAEQLAKDGYLSESYDTFLQIYSEYGLWQAGYNAAMIKEALGNLTQAEKLMSKVYKENPVNKVADGLADIKNEIRLAKRLEQQTEQQDNVLDVDF